MGYRSDVKYVIAFPTAEAKIAFMAQVRMIGGALQDAMDETDHTSHERRIYFAEDSVKWYDSYTGVQAHNKLMQMADEQPPELCDGYDFVRIGEELDDIETRSGGDQPPYDLISVRRFVEFN